MYARPTACCPASSCQQSFYRSKANVFVREPCDLPQAASPKSDAPMWVAHPHRASPRPHSLIHSGWCLLSSFMPLARPCQVINYVFQLKQSIHDGGDGAAVADSSDGDVDNEMAHAGSRRGAHGTLLQLVPLRGTTIGAETRRGSETKERVYEAAALP